MQNYFWHEIESRTNKFVVKMVANEWLQMKSIVKQPLHWMKEIWNPTFKFERDLRSIIWFKDFLSNLPLKIIIHCVMGQYNNMGQPSTTLEVLSWIYKLLVFTSPRLMTCSISIKQNLHEFFSLLWYISKAMKCVDLRSECCETVV